MKNYVFFSNKKIVHNLFIVFTSKRKKKFVYDHELRSILQRPRLFSCPIITLSRKFNFSQYPELHKIIDEIEFNKLNIFFSNWKSY